MQAVNQSGVATRKQWAVFEASTSQDAVQALTF